MDRYGVNSAVNKYFSHQYNKYIRVSYYYTYIANKLYTCSYVTKHLVIIICMIVGDCIV